MTRSFKIFIAGAVAAILMAVGGAVQAYAAEAPADSAAAPLAAAHQHEETVVEKAEEKLDAKELIFEHVLDGYGWDVPFNHHKRIPLPVIVYCSDGFHIFSSARVAHGETYRDGDVDFRIAPKGSEYAGKIVEIRDGQEIKPIADISITKNVLALFITVILVLASVWSIMRWYQREGNKAPRGLLGALEVLVQFIYNGVIKPTLGAKSMHYAPYLLTVFFFILYMNLGGLIVIFPGGANLTGNIAVTLVLALFTFFFTNMFATKHYWKEIFWPDVPLFLKFPIPIMQIIEIFGVFTKPAALTIRLFANMLGGHLIVLSLTILIFVFTSLGALVTTSATIVSVIFSVFMLCIDVLVSFIQAYVFTMLSTIFIGLAQEDGHHEKHEAHPDAGAQAAAAVEAPKA